MNSDWQTWTALGVVAVATVLLVRSWWRRRGHEHEGCDCPGASGSRDLARLKKRIPRG